VTARPGAVVVDLPLTTTDFETTAQRIEAYADAIGDDNPRYRRHGRSTDHMVAAPTLAAAYMQDPVRRLFADKDALAELGIDGDRVVFGEIEYEFHHVVKPGNWVTVEGEMVDRTPRGGKEVLRFETRAVLDDGTLATRALITFVAL
jgi:hypothetical protein